MPINTTNTTQAAVPYRCTGNADALQLASLQDFLSNTIVSLVDMLYTDAADRLRDGLMSTMQTNFNLENAVRRVNHEPVFRCPTSLPGPLAAGLVIASGDVRTVQIGPKGTRIVMKRYYRDSHGSIKWAGYWSICDTDSPSDDIMVLFQKLCPFGTNLDQTQYVKKLYQAPRATTTTDKMLVFWRNGVWDFKDMTFTAYDDPDYDSKYPTEIALTKCAAYYPRGTGPAGKIAPMVNGTCPEPILTDRGNGEPWRPSDAFTGPFYMDTAEGQASSLIMYQAAQLLIRGRNSTHGYYHFWTNSDGKGHDGKSTLLDLMLRMIVVPQAQACLPENADLPPQGDAVINCPIEKLDDNYSLGENILTARAIIAHETDAAGSTAYVDTCAKPKLLARREPVKVREIYKPPFDFVFDGFLAQLSNKFLKFSEKNDSIISHAIVTKFEKHFSDEYGYIKEDYIHRDIVVSWLAYYLCEVLPLCDEYDADALAVLKPNGKEMLKDSITTFQFCDDVLSGINLSVIPLEFLYDLYRRWCKKQGIADRYVVPFKTFRDDMEQYGLNNTHSVHFEAKRMRINVAELDNNLCPAISDYGVIDGMPKFAWGLESYQSAANDQNKTGARRLVGYVLNKEQFLSPDGTSKRFNKGCLVRDVAYADMHYFDDDQD